MENDIITITDHIEIHPSENGGMYCVVRDGSVYGRYATEDEAREIADGLARRRKRKRKFPRAPSGNTARHQQQTGHEDMTMRMNELQKAYGIAVKAFEDQDIPREARERFHLIADHIWKSCGDRRDEQAGLVIAADKIAGR